MLDSTLVLLHVSQTGRLELLALKTCKGSIVINFALGFDYVVAMKVLSVSLHRSETLAAPMALVQQRKVPWTFIFVGKIEVGLSSFMGLDLPCLSTLGDSCIVESATLRLNILAIFYIVRYYFMIFTELSRCCQCPPTTKTASFVQLSSHEITVLYVNLLSLINGLATFFLP